MAIEQWKHALLLVPSSWAVANVIPWVDDIVVGGGLELLGLGGRRTFLQGKTCFSVVIGEEFGGRLGWLR